MISFFFFLFFKLHLVIWSCMQNSYCMVYLSHSSLILQREKWMKYQPNECLLRDVGDYTANMRCGCWNCTNIDNLRKKKNRKEMQVMDVLLYEAFFFLIQANIITKYKNVIIYSKNRIERRRGKKADIRMHTKME